MAAMGAMAWAALEPESGSWSQLKNDKIGQRVVDSGERSKIIAVANDTQYHLRQVAVRSHPKTLLRGRPFASVEAWHGSPPHSGDTSGVAGYNPPKPTVGCVRRLDSGGLP